MQLGSLNLDGVSSAVAILRIRIAVDLAGVLCNDSPGDGAFCISIPYGHLAKGSVLPVLLTLRLK